MTGAYSSPREAAYELGFEHGMDGAGPNPHMVRVPGYSDGLAEGRQARIDDLLGRTSGPDVIDVDTD
jgi:hypothetical protein